MYYHFVFYDFLGGYNFQYKFNYEQPVIYFVFCFFKLFKENNRKKFRCTYLQALVYNHEGVARIENGPQRVMF